jgi:hypothetical protein
VDEIQIAGAIAYFETCDDLALLRDLLREIQPRASSAVRRLQQQRRPVPPPLEVQPAPEAASREEALRTAREVGDFAQLQAIARAIGRRVEALTAH